MAVSGNQKASSPKHKRRILRRTALMAWFLVVFTAIVLILITIPSQRSQLLEEMRQRAKVAYTSTLQVAVESIVLEDYSGIVEHCINMVSKNPGLKYVVLTREDGFSLIHTHTMWKQDTLYGIWKPSLTEGDIKGQFLEHSFSDGEVFHLSYPLNYSGIDWGWIHLGLSPDKFFKDLRHLYSRTFVVAMLAVVGGLLASFVYARRLTVPIQRLDRFARELGEGGDLSQRIEIQTGDEVQSLAESFNDMVEELDRSNRKLVNTARQAGMTEMAVNVLHNVGNVLNSVGVTTQNLQRRVGQSRMAAMQPVIELMKGQENNVADFIANDPRGKKLPEYLSALSSHLCEDHKVITAGLDDLERHIQHIQDIVSLQQRYSRTVGLNERVNLVEVIEDAIAFNTSDIKGLGISIEKKYAAPPEIVLDRQKLLQILTNLISNARHALQTDAAQPKKIVIETDSSGNRTLSISISDNGVGIIDENLTRIFQHGFTTRQGGHGFGLHSSGLAASEMGGTLTAKSPGQGKGATFTLELPLRIPELEDESEH